MTTSELTKKYPFLKIKNSKHTWADDLEPGWKIAFGDELWEDLSNAIKKDQCEDVFELVQIKEKFGALRIYAFGHGDNVRDVLAKYEELSRYYCGRCGQPAKYVTTGWIYPLCDKCVELVHGYYAPIEQYYSFNSYSDVEQEIKNIKENFNYDDYWKKV